MYSANYQNYLVLTVVRVFCGVFVCVCVRACVCHQLLPVEAGCCSKTLLSYYTTFAHFWLGKLSIGRTEVSNMCSSSDSGFT